MKKNIGFISIDSSLAVWLYEKIRLSAHNTGGADELEEGLAELISGETSSLMLEIGGEEKENNKENNKESHGKNRALLSDDAISCGDLTVYGRNRKVVRDGEEISLTPKEFDILYFLVRNRGEVFTKEQIYQAVWENDYMLDDSNIMAFIRKLRKKIEPNPDAPEYILTIWGIGYKFNDRI
ncbi:MAG: winged helix-turn-helix domain-containing protein [Eubacteriales bacterium]|nr:winged helix-turn-helix domain-containing protein [Eubacteriales bacterium]